MIFPVNAGILLLYILALALHQQLHISWPVQIAGIVWLLLITPFNLTKITKLELPGSIEKYFSWLTVFFFLFAPAYYIVHRTLGLQITAENILITNIAVSAIACTIALWRKEKLFPVMPNIHWKRYIKKHSLLIAALALFTVTHTINYSFYVFIPEADGYTDIRNIETFLEGESIEGGRKPAFYTAMTAISSFARIAPYSLFSFWMIALQTTLIIAVYAFIRIFRIKSTAVKAALLITAIAVPVINLETDVVRSQTLYILAFPMWALFMHRAIAKNSTAHWIYAGTISVFGMLYHEFFFFLLLAYSAILFHTLAKKYYWHAKDRKDKNIFGLSIALGAAVAYILFQEFRALQFVSRFLTRTWGRAANTSEWRLWFLDNYTTDGAQMGWPGITGAAQYYGYYLSPAILLLLILLIIFFTKIKANRKAFPLLITTIPLLITLLFFAEGLPRINSPYLPERIWLLVTLILTILAVPLWKAMEQKRSLLQTMLLSYFILLTIGIFGSFYVAQSKGSETSPAEYEATQWIQANTPSSAIFITQGKNGRMIGYFAQRQRITPSEEYFLSDEVFPFIPENQEELLRQQLINEKKGIVDELEEAIEYDMQLWDQFITSASRRKNEIERIKEELTRLETEGRPELYVLYSEDKFNGLYAQREWWKKVNFYGANLEKFNEAYPLVYSQDGVHIWKVE